MKMIVSDEANRERIAQDFSTNLVVEAGAGTGKTTLLVERALRALVTEGMRVDQLVLVTFMERAAEEIRERLSSRLQSAIAQGSGLPKARSQSALAHLDQAVITTIHGLGQRILSEFAVEAEVPIGFRVLDGYDQSRLWSECWQGWLGGVQHSEAHEIVHTLLVLGESVDTLKDMAREVTEWDEIWEIKAPGVDIGAFFSEWHARFQEWYQFSQSAAPDSDPGRVQVKTLIEHLAFVCAMDPSTKARALIAWTLSLSAKGNQKNWRPKDTLKTQKELIRSFQDVLHTIQERYAAHLLEQWLNTIRLDLIPFWKAYRWQRGQLAFDDLLRETRNLLRHHPEVRQTLYQRWRLILVDEFQDTDPTQSEILFRLAGDPNQSDWQTSELPPGRLFLVGDVKQSIYRFRGADVETFQTMRQKVVRDGGAVLKVKQNFRSEAGILDFVNQIFRERMPDQPDIERPYLAVYDPLVASRDHGNQKRVSIRIAPGAGTADLRRQAEAQETVEVIAQAIAEGWPIWDPRTETERRLQYRDIAILMPNRTGIDWYRDLFIERGIPLASLGGVGFFHQDEIRGFSSVLSLLSDPDDEVAWLAFFLSPWVGASHAEVEAYREAGGAFGPSGERVSGTLGQWGQILLEWLMRREEWLPVDVFDALSRVSGLLPFLHTQGDRQALANLAKLREMARMHGQSWGFREFANWLSDRVESGENESEGVVEDLGDAVQLSTVHQAKGLEWPMCIITNWHLEFHAPQHILRDAERRVVGWRTRYFNSPQYEALKMDAQDRELAERSRLLYVALTRPRDYLVVIERFNEKNGSGLNLRPDV
jgi:ATP-dependent helicase/nuclease subunit A